MTTKLNLMSTDKQPEPTFLYETTIQFATQIAMEREKFIISASQKLGINPLIVAEQSSMIKDLKDEIRKVRYQLSLFNATFPMDLDAFPALAEFLDPQEA
jgi:hypothetical protein